MTVDNGIASLEGVAYAQAAGLAVVVTDHHLPVRVDGEVALPDADVIVNPNQPDCTFASKHLAGVGVAFYVLLALRAELRARGEFGVAEQPRLDALLDLVALGTVADVVRLDRNNRCLVAQGLKRVRAGRMQAGVAALFAVAGRDPRQASAGDFGFAIGPRLNAAGRLADMTLGIECLLSDDPARAHELATLLDDDEPRAAHARGRHARGRRGAGRPRVRAHRRDRAGARGLRSVVPRRRRRHHRRAPEGSAASAELRVRARPGRRAQGLGSVDRRLSPARCARPRQQAPSRAAGALRRPRDGGRLHHRARRFRDLPRRAAAGRGRRPRRERRSSARSSATARSPPSISIR